MVSKLEVISKGYCGISVEGLFDTLHFLCKKYRDIMWDLCDGAMGALRLCSRSLHLRSHDLRSSFGKARRTADSRAFVEATWTCGPTLQLYRESHFGRRFHSEYLCC